MQGWGRLSNKTFGPRAAEPGAGSAVGRLFAARNNRDHPVTSAKTRVLQLRSRQIDHRITVCKSLMGVYLTGVHLISVYLINVHLTGVYPMSMHVTDVHLMGLCLTVVDLSRSEFLRYPSCGVVPIVRRSCSQLERLRLNSNHFKTNMRVLWSRLTELTATLFSYKYTQR